MRKLLLSALITGILLLAITVPAVLAKPPGPKATICHIPPGNPAAAHTITVGERAVPAHLAHGDTLGACSVGYP